MGILVVVMSSRPSTAGTYRPSTWGSYRPSSAGTYRSSSSVIGAHGKTNKFAATKSRYQRPQSAPVGGRNKNKTTNTASKIFRHNGDTYAVPPITCRSWYLFIFGLGKASAQTHWLQAITRTWR